MCCFSETFKFSCKSNFRTFYDSLWSVRVMSFECNWFTSCHTTCSKQMGKWQSEGDLTDLVSCEVSMWLAEGLLQLWRCAREPVIFISLKIFKLLDLGWGEEAWQVCGQTTALFISLFKCSFMIRSFNQKVFWFNRLLTHSMSVMMHWRRKPTFTAIFFIIHSTYRSG